MKTLIIYNNLEEELKYFIVEGDFSRFDGITFNTSLSDKLESECSEWLWDSKGNLKHEMSNDVSLIENKNWDKVAIITWIP